ncbi:MAG TPA: hypothetical protein VK907_12940, partial [Phnomibacter sp.]|nr:hypothetical protein [Phnomibacter sp.]
MGNCPPAVASIAFPIQKRTIMKTYRCRLSSASMLAGILFPLCSLAQTSTSVKDHLSIPGPIVFEQRSYSLTWSAHPSANYYKQEYLPKGEVPGKHRSMLMMEVLTGS